MFVVWETKTPHHHQLARLTWPGKRCLMLSWDKKTRNGVRSIKCRHAVIETRAAQALWVSITATTCNNHQCKKENLRSKSQKEVCCCWRCFWVVLEPALGKSGCPCCPPQRGFGAGSPSAAGLISACVEGGGTVPLVWTCTSLHAHKGFFQKSSPCRTDRALVPPGEEEQCFFSFIFIFMSHSDWRSPFFSPLFFCGLCLLLLIILFPLESAISLSFCTRVFFPIQPVWGFQAPLLSIPAWPPYSEGLGGIRKLCCVRDTCVGTQMVLCCTKVLAPSLNLGRFSNESQ